MGIEFSGAGGSFSDPGRSFGKLEAAVVATMVAAATDIALLIDRNGRIDGVAVDDNRLFGAARKAWLGRRFVDVVTVESRPKVEKMLAEDGQAALPKRREVNHPMPGGADLPVSYTVLTLSREEGVRIALGRELRSISLLQQKLVETQLAMENDYARLRNAEAQYRVLFDTAAEPTLIVDASTRKVAEANAAARRMLGGDGRRVVGQSLDALFADQSLRDLDQLIAAARVSGETETADLILSGDDRVLPVALRFYRQHGATRLSLRFGRPPPTSLSAGGTGPAPLRSTNDMTGLVGRVPLREIVRETVDLIEQLCIEAALDITRNNRAAASEMLGLSRQSLSSKLRRYGIGEAGQSGDGEDIGDID